MTSESFNRIKQLLTSHVSKYIELDHDLYSIDLDTYFARVERSFLIHTACLDECKHLLTLSNMAELAEVLDHVFRGHRYIYDSFIKQFIILRDELLKERFAKKPQTVPPPTASDSLQTQLALKLLSNQSSSEAYNEVQKELANLMKVSFVDEEQKKEEEEQRRRVIEAKVDKMVARLDRDEEVDIGQEYDPNVLIAYCNRIHKGILKENKASSQELHEHFKVIDKLLQLKAQAPEKIEKIVEHIMATVQSVGISQIEISSFKEERLVEQYKRIEHTMFSAFDKSQKKMAVRVLKYLLDQLRPPNKTIGTMTMLTAKKLEGTDEESSNKLSYQIKKLGDERMALLDDLRRTREQCKNHEISIKLLLEEVNTKEAEIIELMRRYSEKAGIGDKEAKLNLESRMAKMSILQLNIKNSNQEHGDENVDPQKRLASQAYLKVGYLDKVVQFLIHSTKLYGLDQMTPKQFKSLKDYLVAQVRHELTKEEFKALDVENLIHELIINQIAIQGININKFQERFEKAFEKKDTKKSQFGSEDNESSNILNQSKMTSNKILVLPPQSRSPFNDSRISGKSINESMIFGDDINNPNSNKACKLVLTSCHQIPNRCQRR